MNTNVLLLGETGVGKSLVAESIHVSSKKRSGPFIHVDCTSLHENLIESEVFGHRKGAFTGAISDRIGLIESGEGGTIFLDEIGDTSISFQAKLLLATEKRVVRRVGENTLRRIDIRFIFATNKNLLKLAKSGTFREDLYYRISVLTYWIKPLNERQEDIPLLAEYMLKKVGGNTKYSISSSAMSKLRNHKYPGNVRELENILMRAIAVSRSQQICDENISFENLDEMYASYSKSKYTRRDILSALLECKGNRTKAATKLGISRVHFYRLLKRLSS